MPRSALSSAWIDNRFAIELISLSSLRASSSAAGAGANAKHFSAAIITRFAAIELAATLPGVPFYAAFSYVPGEKSDVPLANALSLQIVRMTKELSGVQKRRQPR